MNFGHYLKSTVKPEDPVGNKDKCYFYRNLNRGEHFYFACILLHFFLLCKLGEKTKHQIAAAVHFRY